MVLFISFLFPVLELCKYRLLNPKKKRKKKGRYVSQMVKSLVSDSSIGYNFSWCGQY